jgi:hypothetical protein
MIQIHLVRGEAAIQLSLSLSLNPLAFQVIFQTFLIGDHQQILRHPIHLELRIVYSNSSFHIINQQDSRNLKVILNKPINLAIQFNNNPKDNNKMCNLITSFQIITTQIMLIY